MVVQELDTEQIGNLEHKLFKAVLQGALPVYSQHPDIICEWLMFIVRE